MTELLLAKSTAVSEADLTIFLTGLPKIVFDRESIRIFVPQKRPCVYRLLNAEGKILYIGASLNPRTRLLAHLRDGKPALTVALEFCSSTTMMARKEKLAIETEPHLMDCGFGRLHATWKARKS